VILPERKAGVIIRYCLNEAMQFLFHMETEYFIKY